MRIHDIPVHTHHTSVLSPQDDSDTGRSSRHTDASSSLSRCSDTVDTRRHRRHSNGCPTGTPCLVSNLSCYVQLSRHKPRAHTSLLILMLQWMHLSDFILTFSSKIHYNLTCRYVSQKNHILCLNNRKVTLSQPVACGKYTAGTFLKRCHQP